MTAPDSPPRLTVSIWMQHAALLLREYPFPFVCHCPSLTVASAPILSDEAAPIRNCNGGERAAGITEQFMSPMIEAVATVYSSALHAAPGVELFVDEIGMAKL